MIVNLVRIIYQRQSFVELRAGSNGKGVGGVVFPITDFAGRLHQKRTELT